MGGRGYEKYFEVKPRPRKLAKPRGHPKKRTKAVRALSPPGMNIPTELIAPVPAPVATFDIAEEAAPVIAGFKATENLPKNTSRINLAKGEHCVKLEKVIHDWNEKEGNIYDDNGERIDDYNVFANRIGIPANAFYKYINPNEPRQIGDRSCCKKRLMTADEIKFAGWILAWANRGNDGLSSKEAVDMIQELVPNITRVSARRQMQRYVMLLNAVIGVLKRTTQKVQATTSDRTNINVAQQYHWHRAVDEVYDYLRKNRAVPEDWQNFW
jgi:hypothetical protein